MSAIERKRNGRFGEVSSLRIHHDKVAGTIEISLSAIISFGDIPIWPNPAGQSERRPSIVIAKSRGVSPCIDATADRGGLGICSHTSLVCLPSDESAKYEPSSSTCQIPVKRWDGPNGKHIVSPTYRSFLRSPP